MLIPKQDLFKLSYGHLIIVLRQIAKTYPLIQWDLMSKGVASHSCAKVHVLALANTEQSAGYSFKKENK